MDPQLSSARVLLFAGQGAQYKGMGGELWNAFPLITKAAYDILGYSLRELCCNDPDNKLRLTEYTQPALYTVHALHYYKWKENSEGYPAAAAGHSLGEYAALLAAGCFDFETGLRLVQERGRLMSEARGGGMAAVLGMLSDTIQKLLRENDLGGIDLANYNAPSQVVLAGSEGDLKKAESVLTQQGARYVPLNVSAPFHSRYMRPAQDAFAAFLKGFTFKDPTFPVIANATAQPYGTGQVAELLARQIASPVLWTDSMRYLLSQGKTDFHEVGADPARPGGAVLTRLLVEIRKDYDSMPHAQQAGSVSSEQKTAYANQPESLSAASARLKDQTGIQSPEKTVFTAQKTAIVPQKTGIVTEKTTAGPQNLGSPEFRRRYRLSYAYVAGGMYRGTSSAAMVIRMGQAGMLGFLGTGGMRLQDVEDAIKTIQSGLGDDKPYGINVLADHGGDSRERAVIDLCLKHRVRTIEAAAFLQMTPALVLFRLKGLEKDASGIVRCRNRIMGKVSRREVAEAFMSPPPRPFVEALLKEGAITPEQAEWAKRVPMSHDICVEADSGGHTDAGVASILLPAMLLLRDDIQEKFRYAEPICMGLGGGIGTPAAAAAAFAMGADFILTGSINQCTVESGATNTVKDLLNEAGIHDMAYAPAGDMFEMGARVQVLKKGLLFPMRANRLHALYTHYNSLEELPAAERDRLEKTFFKRSLDDVWHDCLGYLEKGGRAKDADLVKKNPKARMARVFRWYFNYSTRLAFEEQPEDQVNCQIHTEPALGAFNQWVRGTDLEPWRARHVDAVALRLLQATAEHMRKGCEKAKIIGRNRPE